MRSIKLSLSFIAFLFLTHTTMAQTDAKKYDSLWKKVDELISIKGLPKSALTEVNKIYTLADKENQEAQLIKALIYRINLTETGENGGETAIEWLEKETIAAKEPVRSILNSILASAYRDYFQNNRWKLYNRTATVNFKKEDLATWGVADLHQRISQLYLSSIKEEKLLQQTKPAAYDAIITKGNARHLRPTLFDLLAHRALEYFKDDERDLAKAAYTFEIDEEAAFAPAAEFSLHQFITRDSASLQHKALLLYQKLIAFHLPDPKPDALIDADLQRLQFVREKAVMENKEELYYAAVNHLATRYAQLSAGAQAWYLLAQWHADKAAQYNASGDTSNRYEYLEAKNICEKTLRLKDSSEGRSNCHNLLAQIQRRELHHITEKVNLPRQPFRALVKYRNLTQIYARIITWDDKRMQKLQNRYTEDYWKQLIKLPSLQSWSQSLPDTKDYQEHATEIKVDALPPGKYLLLTSAGSNFTDDQNPLSVTTFYVSAISFINRDNAYFVLHRETGKPLANAHVQVWNNSYDYKLRKNNNSIAERLQTDLNGYFKLQDTSRENKNIRLEISYNNDHLFMDDSYYTYYRAARQQEPDAAAYEENNTRAFLFMDRSIYRPGQMVFFKGIAVTKDFNTKKSKILAGKKTKVFLEDANGDEIDSLELVTNDFGSYSGKFILPENTLNGIFTLSDEELEGHLSFSVEEYKRPKFYVDYEKLKGTYRINDSITVTGFAKAYAGNFIDGAQVNYRVVRRPRFIYPWLFGKWGRPPVTEMEITHGTISAGSEGKFLISFKAIPDKNLNKSLDPVFDYKVIADITDINGETRSGELNVSVSYKALQLQVSLPGGSSLSSDSLKHVLIATRNMNGEYEPASVRVQLYPLQQPERLIRSRYWQEPDQFIMSREEYIRLFPHDEYRDESNKENWARKEQVVDYTNSSTENKRFDLPHPKLLPGWYVAEISTTDKYGETIKDLKYLLIQDEKSRQLPVQEYITSALQQSVMEPGGKALLTLGTAADELTVIQEVQKAGGNKLPAKQTSYQLISLRQEKKILDFPVTEDDRGGIDISHFFVKDNRFFTIRNNIIVPWSNKELTISYETYRDKTLPGSEENWKVKISGRQKEKVAAEMLAAMYDESLDQFKPHNWTVPGIWSSDFLSGTWQGYNCFNSIQSDDKYPNDGSTDLFSKSYDELNSRLTLGNNRLMVKALVGAVPGISMARDASLKKVDIEYESKKEMTAANRVIIITTKSGSAAATDQAVVQIRKNFNETAFFLPDLQTDTEGNIAFSFTMPEALTRWKFQALAHTRDLAFGYITTSLITQKELMVQPNVPRFLREGDRMELRVKIVNLGNREITGTIQMELLNASSMKPVDGIFQNMNANQYFTVEAGKSAPANFTIEVPYQYNNAVIYRFIARANADSAGHVISDGEESSLPVLTNSMLVTETMPLPVRGPREKQFIFDKLLQSGNSATLQQYALSVEFTSNPAWYAIQALPYLIEYPYDCSEQTFNKFYANALAYKIANTSPKLKALFEKWKTTDTAALLSNLQKNPELKSVLLEETPWVLEAKTEAQQKKNIALLFDLVKMEKELNASLDKLIQIQSSNGGFVWFKGGSDDRYITQYILTGIGHLKKLNAVPAFAREKLDALVKAAFPYADSRLQEDYDQLIKSKADRSKNNISYLQIQYLYMRSFYPEAAIPGNILTAVTYYRKQSQQFWVRQNNYMQGMIALQLFRTGDKQTAASILKSLKENAVISEEMGMYWKYNRASYYWQEAPIETQSLLIEAFAEINKDNKATDNLKTWLLKQKQTNNWGTTKASADACYALLLQGSDWLAETPGVTIKLGDKLLNSTETDSLEAGTGYFKTSIEPPFIKPAMGNISVKLSSADTSSTLPAWGGVYWQYFEQLDKITPSATPLKLTKHLFIEKNSDRGPVLQPIMEGGLIKVGDKIKVRIELRVDRDMEYVHLKDMRASCMEPVNVLSGYKWQGGLGYYESTKDASTNFFFNQLPKGTYVFEYPLFAAMSGNFSNGITTIQCMYAPEFSSHSEGIRINVE